MTEERTITNERVDDTPLLLTHMERMGLQSLLDAHFPTHGKDLCPLSEIQMPAEQLEDAPAPAWSGEQALPPIYREQENGERERIAEGLERQEVLTAEVECQTITCPRPLPQAACWTERRLVVRSLKQAQTAEAALRVRLEKAQNALAALNERGRGKKRFPDEASLRQAAEAIIARYQV